MEISNELPPNYKDIIKILPEVEGNKRVVFTFGKFIYNPGGGNIPYHLIAHELVHEKQQSKGLFMTPERWWKKYLKDKRFRFTQEIEAYRTQYKLVKKISNNREEVNRLLARFAMDLSSPIYGSIVTTTEAIDLIKVD